MLVSEILKKKSGSVFRMLPTASIETAVRNFRDKKIGAIMICEARGDIVGILTERDVLHGQAETGAEALECEVQELMSGVHTCKPEDDVNSVMRLMTYKHVRHVPVVVAGELQGMISIGDIVKHQLDQAQLELDTMRDIARVR